MTALTRSFRRRLQRRDRAAGAGDAAVEPAPAAADAPPEQEAPVEIAPNDPLLAYFQSASEAVDIDALELDSPALRELKAAGVKLAVPLVSQGELIGVLNLGPRLSEQDYSSDDRRLLDNLAAQAAPALRVGQLVREQEAEAATRQRFEQELEVARLIQQHFLPKELPDLPGWQIAAFYRPAREVGGDFYDVIPLPDGRVGFVVGRRDRQGRPGRARHVRHAQRAARLGPAPDRARRGARARQRAPVPRHAGEDVRDLPLRRAGHRAAACFASPTRATTFPTSRPPTAWSSCAPAACRSASCRACPTRRRRPRSSPGDSVLLHSDGVARGPRPRARHVRLSAAQGDHGPSARRPGADRPRALRPRGLHRPRTPSRRTTSRW